MKKVIALLLPLVLLSRSGAQPTNAPVAGKNSVTPPQVIFLESEETKERNEMPARVLSLFTNRDYDALEKMAAEYRASQAEYADGFQKLAFVYNGVTPACGAPDEIWQAHQIQLQDWIRAKPDSPTPRIALARLLTAYAWKARGSGWASKVRQEDWQTFFSRLQTALRYLQSANQLKCPAYWSSLQQIGLGLQFDRAQYDRIFAQATNDFPTYPTYYELRAVYLLPRWNGTGHEWEADLAKSADRMGGDAGDILYARVVWQMHLTYSSKNVFNEFPEISYSRVVRGFDAIINRYPDSVAAKTELVHLAALFGDKQRAKEYFLKINGQIDVSLWDGRANFDTVYKWLFPT